MLPPRLVAVLARLYEYFKYLDGQIGEIGKNLTHQLDEGDLGQRLLTIPGVGPIAPVCLWRNWVTASNMD